MAILITGGAGFIGSNLIDYLLQNGEKVVCYDNFNNFYKRKWKLENLRNALANKHFRLYDHDIMDKKALLSVFNCNEITEVIHLAARAGVRPSMKNPKLYYKTNVDGLINVLDASILNNIKKLVFASSSSVYGNDSPAPFQESSPCNSQVSPYASTKKIGEIICNDYHVRHGLPITILRFFTVYGPRGRPDMTPYIFVDRALKGKSITVYGDGSSMRDYTYIDDIINGIVLSLKSNLPYETFNLGNSNPVSISYLLNILQEALALKFQIRYEKQFEGDVFKTFASISSAKDKLGWSPSVKLEDGVGAFIEWYKNNRA